VSLALALGLGSITSLQTNIRTLFIDEGFGTLDPDTLEIALSCLDSLQASGRQIGLISHVQGLVERVGTRVQITALGNGHSKVELFAR
jgi:exonuclease SbcC